MVKSSLPDPGASSTPFWHRYSIILLGGRFSIQELALLAGNACTSGCPRIQAQIVRCELPIPSRSSGDPARSFWRRHGLESPHPSAGAPSLLLDSEAGDLDGALGVAIRMARSEEHTSELQSLAYLVCRLLLEKKKKNHASQL